MISQHIIQSIGWALIHSLWQGLAIYLVVKVIFKAIGKADVRYGAGVVAMVLMLISSVITFFILDRQGSSEGFQLIITREVAPAGAASLVQTALQFIDQNIIWLLRFWILGFAAGLLRIAAGLWYINRLRRNANPVQGEWMDLITNLSANLNISRVVTMAEAAITSPMVVGFVKPMILFPVGLLSGLTAEQVETILVHELSHIRRQDYIVNLVQSVIETIFFFNPFALLISSLIREERENCCDDLVIAKGISPISYVKTLAQLEASRSSSTLALGIAGNQNQLLNRIKRIMEKSAKNDWGKGRLVPVALLFLGLMCASWLSIGSEKKEQEAKVASQDLMKVTLASDTSKKDGLKILKKKDNTWELTEPAEPIEVPGFIEAPDHFDAFEVPGAFFEAPPHFPGFDQMVELTFDSLPGARFHLRDGEQWEVFERELTEKFKERFKDFYNKNQKQFDKMLDELRDAEMSRGEARIRRDAAEIIDLESLMLRNEKLDARRNIELAVEMDQLAAMTSKIQAEQVMNAQVLAKIAADQNLEILQDQLHRSSEMHEDMARRYDEFQKVLIEHLVADGYLKSGEGVDQLMINDENGKMSVNGKAIKEKDRVKYKAIQDKMFNTERVRLVPGRSE